ncbi:conserved hypothetical protein [Ricinus communis]|uniref:Uncharacterized protein n=1 Tax=Ricinus communis TaxID=3988 RepID=B9TFJ4_RICCO|nr:conserved hypothetical protein [Ricinus communis]
MRGEHALVARHQRHDRHRFRRTDREIPTGMMLDRTIGAMPSELLVADLASKQAAEHLRIDRTGQTELGRCDWIMPAAPVRAGRHHGHAGRDRSGFVPDGRRGWSRRLAAEWGVRSRRYRAGFPPPCGDLCSEMLDQRGPAEVRVARPPEGATRAETSMAADPWIALSGQSRVQAPDEHALRRERAAQALLPDRPAKAAPFSETCLAVPVSLARSATQHAASAIFAGASEEIGQRRELLEGGKLVDDTIEPPVAIGGQAHDRADRDIEPDSDERPQRRKLIGFDRDEEPAPISPLLNPVADRKPILGIVEIAEAAHDRCKLGLDAGRGPFAFGADECRRIGARNKRGKIFQLRSQQAIE